MKTLIIIASLFTMFYFAVKEWLIECIIYENYSDFMED